MKVGNCTFTNLWSLQDTKKNLGRLVSHPLIFSNPAPTTALNIPCLRETKENACQATFDFLTFLQLTDEHYAEDSHK